MRTDFVTVETKDRLDDLDRLMHLGRFRHLPVLRDGQLVGVVSSRDLLAASLTKLLRFGKKDREAFLRSVEVSEVMMKPVQTTRVETPLSDAARQMIRHKIGCLPVLDVDQTLVGLITETDLLRAAFVAPGNG